MDLPRGSVAYLTSYAGLELRCGDREGVFEDVGGEGRVRCALRLSLSLVD